ncbi:hypothetical protein D918_03200 [Trichuris suis]|nr:hypothetical protein D918_03200 [Trichuris suis]
MSTVHNQICTLNEFNICGYSYRKLVTESLLYLSIIRSFKFCLSNAGQILPFQKTESLCFDVCGKLRNLFIGTVASIEQNHKELQSVRKGSEVCIKIENTTGEAPKMYGRHFDYQDFLVSRISRETIDVCKEYFREDLQKSDWQLVVELKKVFEIM